MPEFDSTIEYAPIPGFLGYCAGNDGSVWSCWRSTGPPHGKKISDEWHRLEEKIDKRGYHCVGPRTNGKTVQKKVGYFVLLAFIGPCPEGQLIRHLNDQSEDNRLANLAYGTRSDNAEDARKNGRLCIGEKHGMTSITAETVRTIREMRATGSTYREIEAATGVIKVTACAIVKRRNWKHVE